MTTPISECTGAHRAVYYDPPQLVLLDQLALPAELRLCYSKTSQDVCARIKDMTVRGAPAIGAAGAYAVVMAATYERHVDGEDST